MSRLFRTLRLALAATLLVGVTSCATVTGIVTGAFTGLVDGPAEVARHNDEFFAENPEYWVLDVLVVAPLSFVGGPIFGLIKGMAVDVRWIRDETSYGDAFGSYGEASIWRPYSYGFDDEE